jgi:RNA polymerase sigma-70 factor (ECF subfamily)
MERFLADVEKRAFRIARFAVGHHDDALEIVQEAMIKLVQRYASSPREEWAPLFYKILESRIRDHQRRQKVRNKIHQWFGFGGDDGEDPMESLPARADADPAQRNAGNETLDAIESAIGKLPLRQQQAFLLRAWEGLDVAQTARAMECSEGSVKTHYSRALQALREELKEHWHE